MTEPRSALQIPHVPAHTSVASAAALAQSRLLAAVEAILEPVCIVLSLWVLVLMFEGTIGSSWLVASVVAFALAFPGRRLLRSAPRKVLGSILMAWAWTAGLLLAMGFATDQIHLFSTEVIVHWLWLAPASQLVTHWALRSVAPHLVRLQGPAQRAVVVGLNEQGSMLADRLSDTPYTGVKLLGFFDDREPERQVGHERHRMLGRIPELAAYVKANRVQLIYLSLPMASQKRIKELLDALKDTTASVYFVPDMFVTDLIQGRPDMVCGMPVISVCETPFRGPAGVLKWMSDIVLASIILVLISPILLGIAIAVKLTSRGPAIFRQRRYGLDGEQIIVYKFRSMTVAEDGDKVQQATKGDARITRLGAFLRRTSLDELPQFINVLQGRMSIVGPRPHAVSHNEMYRGLIKSYMVRHKVRPGITGWAQVNGFRGETDSLDKMEGRIRMDLDYLRSWSLRLDMRIILRTIRLVFKDSSAY
ncbi:undecaprenyl-phosphate glucose phosphotransferase [Caenimonas sp. SL110]|uniref:undecaprenyl-phosphate glucose phosphotransferase n=1 Tax=Caenimonas sp. SL110 TaxID=1450524 RepID=UPI0009E2D34C|nr:undecaprenyl-phosphate glucose phosphotransferase [Caenimonas sp. SL110]